MCLALWSVPSAPRTHTSIAAASLSLCATAALTGLSYLEHVRSIRPSSIINVYLLLTVPFDFAQVRSLWLRGNFSALSIVFTVSSVVKLGVLVSEAIEKRALLLPPFRNPAPEFTSGIYTRALFWWLNPLFILGYKDVLSDETLLATDERLMSNVVHHQFQRQWARRMRNHCCTKTC